MAIKLTALSLRNAKPGDAPLLDDEVAGLYYIPSATRPQKGRWELRYTSPVTGKRPEVSCGTYPATSLADARKAAREKRALIEAGKDPKLEKQRALHEARTAYGLPTFGEVAKIVHKRERELKGWKATKNDARWIATVEKYLAPLLDVRVDMLTSNDFVQALRPQWLTFHTVSSDVLQRACLIMDYCEHEGFVKGVPTANVRRRLGTPKNRKRVHHPAMPHKLAPGFVAGHLANIEPTDLVRACVFVQMIVACRPHEARGMRWSELKLDEALWTLPEGRMKGNIEHEVPLPAEVVDLLRRMQAAPLDKTFVFPNMKGGKPMTDLRCLKFLRKTGVPSDTKDRAPTPHGFRATFKGWCLAHGYDEKLVERQLAHKPKGETAQAYDRDTLIERRKGLTEQWVNYLYGRKTRKVIPLTAASPAEAAELEALAA